MIMEQTTNVDEISEQITKDMMINNITRWHYIHIPFKYTDTVPYTDSDKGVIVVDISKDDMTEYAIYSDVDGEMIGRRSFDDYDEMVSLLDQCFDVEYKEPVPYNPKD